MAYNTHAYDDSPTICAAASAAITDPAMKAVKFSSGKLALPSAGDPVIGIVLADQGDVAAGDTLNVQIKDICYWIAGGTFAAGDLLKTDANGKCVKADAGNAVNAIALEAGASDVPCKVFLQHTAVPAAAAAAGGD